MPNDEYKHVKTLIRELHGPAKNVSRPPSSSLSSLQIDDPTVDHQNTANNGYDGLSEENTSLLGLRQQTISIISGSTTTSEQLLQQQTLSDDNNELSMSKQKIHHYSNNSLSLPIPSLIVTGVDQADHPYNSQRRFSQFYFGLRRFSNSHTVLYNFFLVF